MSDKNIKGSKSDDSNEVKPPHIDENSLQSMAVAKFVDLIGEGELTGLVHGEQSIYFDNVPIRDSFSGKNFQGITSQPKMGVGDHNPLEDYPISESEISVDQRMLFDIPITKAITDPNIDDVRLTFTIPSLFSVNNVNGDVLKTGVSWRIDLRSTAPGASLAWRTQTAPSPYGKCVSAYQKDIYLSNLKARTYPDPGPWQIRVVRITADSETNNLQNNTYWSSYTQVINRHLIYPDVAAIGITLKAQEFGSRIPSRSYEMYGLKVRAPNNYTPAIEPDTEEDVWTEASYDGIWDGTLEYKYTSNPAWVWYDILNNKRYGMGLDDEYLDRWTLYTVAQYCDQMVPSGRVDVDGIVIKEPRFTFNGVLQSRTDAIQVMNMVASAMRSMPFWAGGVATVTQDSPNDPTKIVTEANVMGGEFVYTGSSIDTRYTVCNVSWNDPGNFYKLTVEPVDDPDGIERYGYRPIDIVAIGCTSRGQAQRFGRWYLDTSQNEIEMVTYRASWDQADVLPGDVIQIMDNHNANTVAGGRLSEVGVTDVTVDRGVLLEVGQTYSVTLVDPDGNLIERDITNIPDDLEHTVLDLSDGWDGTNVPQINSVWLVSASNLEPRHWRVVSNHEVEKQEYEITATQYDPDKFDRVEEGLNIPPPPITKVPDANTPIEAPTNMQWELYTYEDTAGSAASDRKFGILLSWTHTRDTRFFNYEVQWKLSTGAYADNEAFETADNIYDIRPIESGIYSFRVRSKGFGRESTWLTISEIVVDATVEVPPNITGLKVINGDDDSTFNGPDCNITWDALTLSTDTTSPAIYDSTSPIHAAPFDSTLTKIKDYQIQVYTIGDVLLRTQFSLENEFIYTMAMNMLDNGSPLRDFKFKLWARDIYDQLSLTATTLVVTNPAPDMTGLTPTTTPIFNGVKIDWSNITPTDNDMAKFRVFFDTVNPPTTQIAEVGVDTNYWIEAGIDANFTYYAQIEPWDDFGVGVKSDVSGAQPVKLGAEDINTELIGRLDINDSLGNVKADLSHLYDTDYTSTGGITYDSGAWIEYTFPIEQLQDRVHFWCDRGSIDCYIAISDDAGATWTYLKAEADHTLDVDGRMLTAGNEADAITNYWTADAGVGQINTALYPQGLTGTTARIYILTNTVGMYELRFVDQVIAESIVANELSAITANLGTITAGILQSPDLDADEGVLIDLDNEVVKFGGTADPALEWDGSKVALNIKDEGSLNIGDQGKMTLGEEGQLIMEDGGYLRIGNNIELTSDDNNARILVAQETTVDTDTNRLNLSGVDYVIMDQGTVTTFIWDGVNHQPYKSLTRIETGESNNNEWVEIPGVFGSKPRVFITPKIMPTYDKTYPDQSQSFRFEVTDLVHSDNTGLRWKFLARASLELSTGFIGTTINQAVAGTTVITGPTITLPPLVKKLTVNARCNGFNGDVKLTAGTRGTKDTPSIPGYYVTQIHNVISTIYMFYYVTGLGWQQRSFTYNVGAYGNALAGVPFAFTTATHASNPITQFYTRLVYSSTYGAVSVTINGSFSGIRQNLTTVSYTSDLSTAAVLIPGSLNWMAIE